MSTKNPTQQSVPLEHTWNTEMWDWPLQHQDGIVKVNNSKDKFEVCLEVHYFTPNEVQVNVMGEELVIHCRHDERNDAHGRITREIHRCYKLPTDVDSKSLKSRLNQKGILVITADKKHAETNDVGTTTTNDTDTTMKNGSVGTIMKNGIGGKTKKNVVGFE